MMTPARKEPDQSTYSGRFAARLRELREKNKLTAQEVALLVGVKQQSISNWETGTSEPKLDICQKLSKIYKLRSVRLLFPSE